MLLRHLARIGPAILPEKTNKNRAHWLIHPKI